MKRNVIKLISLFFAYTLALSIPTESAHAAGNWTPKPKKESGKKGTPGKRKSAKQSAASSVGAGAGTVAAGAGTQPTGEGKEAVTEEATSALPAAHWGPNKRRGAGIIAAEDNNIDFKRLRIGNLDEEKSYVPGRNDCAYREEVEGPGVSGGEQGPDATAGETKKEAKGIGAGAGAISHQPDTPSALPDLRSFRAPFNSSAGTPAGTPPRLQRGTVGYSGAMPRFRWLSSSCVAALADSDSASASSSSSSSASAAVAPAFVASGAGASTSHGLTVAPISFTGPAVAPDFSSPAFMTHRSSSVRSESAKKAKGKKKKKPIDSGVGLVHMGMGTGSSSSGLLLSSSVASTQTAAPTGGLEGENPYYHIAGSYSAIPLTKEQLAAELRQEEEALLARLSALGIKVDLRADNYSDSRSENGAGAMAPGAGGAGAGHAMPATIPSYFTLLSSASAVADYDGQGDEGDEKETEAERISREAEQAVLRGLAESKGAIDAAEREALEDLAAQQIIDAAAGDPDAKAIELFITGETALGGFDKDTAYRISAKINKIKADGHL